MSVARLFILRVNLGVTLASLLGYAVAAEPDAKKTPNKAADLYGDALPSQAALRLGAARFRHQSIINAAAFSPDGRILASAAANQDPGVALWELPEGKLLQRLVVPAKDYFRPSTNALAFSPDGKKLLTADTGGQLHLWDVGTGNEAYSIAANAGYPGATAVAFSTDGQWMASGGGDGAVRVWSTESGEELLSFDTLPQSEKPIPGPMGFFGNFPPGSISALAFSPDGKLLAAGIGESLARSRIAKIVLWNLESNQPVRRIDESNGVLVSLLFTPDGKQLISGGSATIPREKFGKPYHALNVRISQIRVWDAASGNMLRELLTPELEAGCEAIALSKDGRTLAAGYEKRILLWDFESAEIRRSIDVPSWYGNRGLAISSNGQSVCAPIDNSIGLWNATTGESLSPRIDSHTSFVNATAYAPDGAFIATGGDRTVRVWDATTGKQRWVRSMGSQGGISALAISPDGIFIAAGGPTEHGESGVRIFRSATGDEVRFIPTFEKRFYQLGAQALAFSADGGRLAIARKGKQRGMGVDIDVYEVASGKQQATVATSFGGAVKDMAFSADGKLVFAVDQNAVVGVWDAATGEKRRRFTALKPPPAAPVGKSQQPWIASALFSPDLKTLITSQGRELVIWDVARGEPVRVFDTQGTDKGGNIAISKEGRFAAFTDLLYGGDPGSDVIRVFNLVSGRLIARFELDKDRPAAFSFSPDSTRLVSGMSDGTALVWRLDAKAAK